ncbi:MAG: hypothetical protein OXM87_11550 [Truepera sp.]|nr:hypothetical protein [Truepera sp.]
MPRASSTDRSRAEREVVVVGGDGRGTVVPVFLVTASLVASFGLLTGWLRHL